MNLQNEKCVMIINESLTLGIIANAAAIMGITCRRAAVFTLQYKSQNRTDHTIACVHQISPGYTFQH